MFNILNSSYSLFLSVLLSYVIYVARVISFYRRKEKNWDYSYPLAYIKMLGKLELSGKKKPLKEKIIILKKK